MSLPESFMRDTWAGKAGLAPYEPLQPQELALFDKDFNRLMNWLADVDKFLARKFMEGKQNYIYAAGIFKKQMEMEFGGIEPTSGQYGFSIIPSWAMFSTSVLPVLNNWWQLPVAGLGWQNLWGTAADPINGVSTRGAPAAAVGMRGFYIQGLINVQAASNISAIHLGVGGYLYPCLTTQFFIRNHFLDKVLTYLELPGNLLCHCQGTFYMRVAHEQLGTEELVPLGLMFAEYDYLNGEGGFYV